MQKMFIKRNDFNWPKVLILEKMTSLLIKYEKCIFC